MFYNLQPMGGPQFFFFHLKQTANYWLQRNWKSKLLFFFLFGFPFPKHSNTLYNGCGASSSHNHSSLQFNAIWKARKCQEWRCHPPQTEYSSWLRLFLRLKIIRSLLLQIKFVSTFVWSFFCLKDVFVESLAGVNQSLRVKCSPYIKPKYMTMSI